MRDLPDAAGLLAIAEATGQTPETAELIARALATARRELAAGEVPLAAAAARLGSFYGEGDAGTERLAGLERRLAAEIRAGRYDRGPDAARVHALLRDSARDRVLESNPAWLDGDG